MISGKRCPFASVSARLSAQCHPAGASVVWFIKTCSITPVIRVRKLIKGPFNVFDYSRSCCKIMVLPSTDVFWLSLFWQSSLSRQLGITDENMSQSRSKSTSILMSEHDFASIDRNDRAQFSEDRKNPIRFSSGRPNSDQLINSSHTEEGHVSETSKN
jgi:hypothetical protein